MAPSFLLCSIGAEKPVCMIFCFVDIHSVWTSGVFGRAGRGNCKVGGPHIAVRNCVAYSLGCILFLFSVVPTLCQGVGSLSPQKPNARRFVKEELLSDEEPCAIRLPSAGG